ncbi:MAG: hypothetical protein LBE79_02675 [Tannerella sp.]|jgi:hypothetical protein|nr:hypothetical protein [Tannerella sp.]
MRRRTPEERYNYNVRKQQKTLEEYAEHEIEWADDLLTWYGLQKKEIPVDEYRACAFFKNKEYLRKPGSLTLLYQMYLRCIGELPSVTRENAFDILCFRFKMYAQVLKTGGYDGSTNW